MKTPTITYIALGSNKGERHTYLQHGVDAIFEKIGRILEISPVYQSKAWGFEGNDFLNACLAVETYFSAEIVLKKLLQIEKQHGRKREQNGYANRSLDLDIIFYGQEKILSEKLSLPHPKLTERRFVLKPLADIAPDFSHADFGRPVSKLLAQTPDNSSIHVFDKPLKAPSIKLPALHYLAIEGNIGAGKTSLARLIAQEFQAKLITERYKDNPFLPKFYRDKNRYAFPLEMSFLADRYQQLLDDTSQYDLFSDFIVADYDVYKSMIFAQVTLQHEEKMLYKKLFDIMYKDLAKPDLYVYLYQNTERLLQNIKKRGREYEQNIPEDYLKQINRGYLDFIKSQHHLKVKIIDVSELDFIAKREDYLQIIDELNA